MLKVELFSYEGTYVLLETIFNGIYFDGIKPRCGSATLRGLNHHHNN